MVDQSDNVFDSGFLVSEQNALQLSIPNVFDLVVKNAPDSVALELGSTENAPKLTLTYGQLSKRSRDLAQVLIAQGVRAGDRVALSAARNFDVVIGMLAILRAGAAYVPLDPAYPAERQDFMLQDAGIKVAVKSPDVCQNWTLSDLTIVSTDERSTEESADLPDIAATHPAYVIYTSGSTGTPKGVETPHSAVCQLVVNKSYTKFGSDRRVLHMSSVSFDAATFEIWGALLNGGRCVIFPTSGLPDLGNLRRVLASSEINTLWLTSSLFNSVIDADPTILSGIEELLVGGEALSIEHIRKAQTTLSAQLINGYGPTETTTFACAYRLPATLPSDITSIPIGTPIHDAGVKILDDDLTPVKRGQVGELFIAGPGVGIGYLNRPDLTEERFVTIDGQRTYKTGDLVKLLPDDTIEFVGRKDGQVKVSGHRIELGEIEHVLRDHPDVSNAAASVYSVKGKPDRIAVWLVAAEGHSAPNTTVLRAFVEEKLPAYMRPSDFTFLDALPLTASGKLDRAALGVPKRERPQLDRPFVQPRRGLETEIAAIIGDVIGVDEVGRHDRFFDLGGTSLMALQVLERLRRETGDTLNVAEFFDGPTVEKMAAALQTPVTDDLAVQATTVRSGAGSDRIAIIGVGGRFAGASDVSKFWDMLLDGKSGRVEVTREDLVAAGEDPSLLDDPDYVAAAFPLEDVEGFDAKFFGFTPREVQIMDPQQRIFLEAAWSALENAGHDPRQSSDRIGVFGGVGRNAYLLHNLMSHPDLRAEAHEYSMLIGNERDFPATHVAFRLGLRGPAVTVQTACSTSGVAIHMAAESLRRGECDIALSGGAKVLVPNRIGYHWTEGGPQSADGYLRAFDAEATGMVRGSGAAMVALKRLDDAIEDGDHVYGVLIGSAINNDGNVKAGFTAPSVSGQAEAIAKAYNSAGIEAGSVSMIEAHGTGTVLGDPIEVSGLSRAFGKLSDTNSCALGSVKTNIGHLDAGATAAGLIKSVLSLKNETIPPSLNFSKPNPNIDFENSPFYVPTKATEWPRNDKPRRAGISSFGLGGTNVHLVVEEAPETGARDAVSGPHLFVLSARTDTALAQRAADLAAWLDANETCDLADVAHTLQYGRRRFEKRLCLIVNDRTDAIAQLRQNTPGATLSTRLNAESPSVAFMFPGGGAQYAGMAWGLYSTNATFKETIDACSAHFESKTGTALTDIIFQSDAAVEQPSVALPALLAVEIAMGHLWQSWGVKPTTMIGHSMGEYAAACLAGVLTVEDAMDIVMCRGRLFETLEPGSMLSVPSDLADIQNLITAQLSVAAVNRPGNCVISGPVSDIEKLRQTLTDKGIESRRVHINVAAHSHMVDPILAEFRAAFDSVTLKAPTIPFISNVTGEPITDAQATDPDYWVQHLRSTVEFSKGLSTLFVDPEAVVLEIGPGQTLSTFARQHSSRTSGHEVVATIRHPQETVGDTEFLLTAVAKFWRAGGAIDWKAFAPADRRRIPLPTYPFERTRHWVDAIPFGDTDAGHAPAVSAIAQPEHVESDPVEPAEPLSRFDSILLQLTQVIERLSGLPADQIDPHATFLELGFDSLFLTQANAAFKKTFKVPLTTRQLLESTPRLYSLAEHLDGVLADDAVIQAPQAPAAKSTNTAAPAGAASPVPAAYSPGIASVTKTTTQGLSEDQEAHIDALIAATVARTPKAKESTQKTRNVLADPRTVQGFRLRWKEMVYPILSDKAKGSKIWDIDGNEYVDLVGGYGVTFLGHQADLVVDAIKAQVDKTLAIGPQSVLAGEVAGLVSQLTGMERVAFCNTGSEAVLAAVRMARTVSGKSKVAKFDGHYHGIFDEMQVRGSGQDSRNITLPSAPGIPHEAVQNTVILDYGNPAAFDVIREQADDLALVLVEPVRSRNPDFQPKEYLQELRKVTEELGIPLLFDEIVTGFRSHPGGAQHIFGVKADLATYGKVAGGGLPIGIVAGSPEYMDSLDGGMWDFGDDSVPTADMTWFAGTFVRHPMALASTKATLKHLIDEGPALQENLNARAEKFAANLNRIFTRLKAPLKVEQFASVLRVTFTSHQEYADLMFFHLRNRGIMTYEGRPIFLTTAHSDEDLAKVERAFDESVKELINVGLMEGRDPDGARRIPMATGQQEIWVSAQFSEDASCSYNLCSTLHLKGKFDANILQLALNDLADRHEALRSLPERDGLMQVVRSEITVPMTVENLRHITESAVLEEIEQLKQAEVRLPFNLEAGPLVRARVLRVAEDDHIVMLTVHHVIADGWSCGVLLRDLGPLYAARRDGVVADLPDAQQLSDFVNFQRHPDQLESRVESRTYWLSLHADGLKRIDFPSDRPRPNKRDYTAQRIEIDLDPALTQSLRKVARANKTTLFAALMGGFAAYVTRLTGSSDNTIGFSAAGQPLLGGGSLVGHCVSFLPLKLTTDLTAGFGEHVSDIGASVLDGLEHQNFDFVSFVQENQPKRDADFAPLITVGLNLDPSAKNLAFADFDVDAGSVGRAYENLDMFLNFVEVDDDLELQCTFNTALFDEDTIVRRMHEYLSLIDHCAKNPDAPLGSVPLVSANDRTMFATSQHAGDTYDRTAGLVDVFRQVVASNPDKIALRDASGAGSDGLTYAQIDASSDDWAKWLAASKVGKGDRVAVLLPRGMEYVTAILSILKIGAIYVPIDTEAPVARLDYMIKDSGAQVLLSHSDIDVSALQSPVKVALLDQPVPARKGKKPVFDTPVGDDPAYIMYTSGSTGLPKGVVVPHRAITSLAHGSDFVRLDDTRVLAMLAPPSFDASTFEIWGALLNGGTVAVIPGTGMPPLTRLGQMLATSQVTTLWLTAALFNAIVDQDPTVLNSVDDVLTGGEALSVSHVKAAQSANPSLNIFNGYGPTECTTFTCTYLVPADLNAAAGSVPIGTPVPGRRVFIVDNDLRVLPSGVPGELVVAGDGLALGYWQRDEMTAAAFVADTLSEIGSEGRLYRTGDICRYLSDGTIEYIGRRDGQVKIRGFRIEPGEVEAALSKLQGIENAAVVVDGSGEERRLVAFAVASAKDVQDADVLESLRSVLPRHMVPAKLNLVKDLPTTLNGKLDRAALANLIVQDTSNLVHVPPSTKTERQLAYIWASILRQPVTSVDQSFFDLGGHSLLALKLFDRIARSIGPDLPISTLFSNPTIRELAVLLDREIGSDKALAVSANGEAPWDTSIVINPGPADFRQPFFIVGGAGGNVNNLADLGTEIGKNRPVIGFQTRGILGHTPHEVLTEIASEHIYYMRQHQPVGPYMLAGYSAGAQTAFEMARQLKAAGQDVNVLMLIDTFAPGFTTSLGTDDPFAMPIKLTATARLADEARMIKIHGLRRLKSRIRSKAISLVMRGKALDLVDKISPTYARSKRTSAALFKAARNHTSGPYGGFADLIVSKAVGERETRLLEEHPNLGWSRLIDVAKLRTIQLDTTHDNLVRGKFAGLIADLLEDRLKSSTENGSK